MTNIYGSFDGHLGFRCSLIQTRMVLTLCGSQFWTCIQVSNKTNRYLHSLKDEPSRSFTSILWVRSTYNHQGWRRSQLLQLIWTSTDKVAVYPNISSNPNHRVGVYPSFQITGPGSKKCWICLGAFHWMPGSWCHASGWATSRMNLASYY